jgi:hypothetical protein
MLAPLRIRLFVSLPIRLLILWLILLIRRLGFLFENFFHNMHLEVC